VAAGYAARRQADPQRFVRIDAQQTIEAVWLDVHAAMRQRGLLP
jgi:thymidylate kinase